MKFHLYILLYCISFMLVAKASVPDAVLDYKTEHKIAANDKILKIETDIDGDGKNEILLNLKSNLEMDKENHEVAGWTLYIPGNTPATTFSKSQGTETKLNELSVDDIPRIDHERCFVGLISELGKRGILTMRYNNPREGPSIGIIYVYTIEGDHLKKTELARFSHSATPNVLFTKYLEDDKRTVITPVELTP